VILAGGPSDGTRMRVVWPAVEFMRLAIPEWATYRWTGARYDYVGPERVAVYQAQDRVE